MGSATTRSGRPSGEWSRAIALRAASDKPQILSTSRHVTQGLVDLAKVQWDDASKTLRGTSRVVAGDDYEIRIDSGAMNFSSAQAADLKAETKEDGRHLRVLLHPQKTGEVSWEISFQFP